MKRRTTVHPFFDPSSRWYYSLHWLVLIFLGLGIYGRTFGFGFVFDDKFFMLNTPYIRSFDRIDQIWTILPKTRLLGVYSFALNYLINGLDPHGYHIFNFVIHLVAAGLVWACAALLLQIAGWEPQELAFAVAVLFLVHPCQTQAVTYIAQRFESMATVFYLGSIYFYLCGRISSSQGHKIFLFISCVGCAICGIFTKEVAATLPLMLLAIELIFFKGNRRWKIGMALGLGGLCFFMLFRKLIGTDLNIFFHFNPVPSESHDGDIITAQKYILTQMRVFLTFMRLLVWPFGQNLDYDYPLSRGILDPPGTLIGICVIGAAVISCFKLRKKFPIIAFGLAWILITFSINLAPRVNVIFEHKLYLISFGFFLILASALFMIIRQRILLAGILITVIAVLSVLSFLRNEVWKNELALWADVVQKSPHKARAYNNLGVVYGRQGNVLQSLYDFNKAVEINPKFAEAYSNRGNSYSKQGNNAQAILDLNKAIEINPKYAGAYTNRGIVYFQEGKLRQALSDYNKAIAVNVYYADAYYNRGILYYKQNNFTQALLDYNTTIEIDPNVAEVYISRGNIYDERGDLTDALSDYNRGIAINPNMAGAYYNRGRVYNKQNDFYQAILEFTQAIAVDHDYADAYYNRGLAYSSQDMYAQAIVDFTKAIKISPDHAEDYYNRGLMFAKQGNFVLAVRDFNEAIKISPDYAKAYINRGVIMAQQGRYLQALLDFNKAIAIDHDSAEVYVDRGNIYSRQGSLMQALSDYNKAIEINSRSVEAYYNRAVTYYQLKKYDSAWKDVDKVVSFGIKINPKFLEDLKKASGLGSSV